MLLVLLLAIVEIESSIGFSPKWQDKVIVSLGNHVKIAWCNINTFLKYRNNFKLMRLVEWEKTRFERKALGPHEAKSISTVLVFAFPLKLASKRSMADLLPGPTSAFVSILRQ